MPSLRGRTLACGLMACAALVVQAGDAAGGGGAFVLHHLLVDQIGTPPPATSSVTYTPMRRPGAKAPPAATLAMPPAPRAPSPSVYAPPVAAKPTNVAPGPAPFTYAAPAPVAPVYAAPAPVAPVYAAPVSAAPSWAMPEPYAPAPLQLPPALLLGVKAEPAATVVAKARRPDQLGHRYFGLATDVGMPDGLNLGLVLAPADWMRLGASLGTNSASLNYRGGLSIIPVGWGPSFSLEAGHCNTAPTTKVVRTFFTVPAWVQSYVQELGYTYVNAHVGFDYRLGGFTMFVHGGATYLMGTIRSPDAIVVDSKTNTSVKIAQDGHVTAYTLSAKAGIIYMFGDP